MIRLALVAPSGSGKSTFATLLEECFQARGMSVVRLKLAEPLYDLQKNFYRTAGFGVNYYQQNHALLESIADWLRLLNPDCIVQSFLDSLSGHPADVVINDDIRDLVTDWPKLENVGFKAILISASPAMRAARMKQRGDLNSILHSKLDNDLSRFPFSYRIDNETFSLTDLKACAEALCTDLTARQERST